MNGELAHNDDVIEAELVDQRPQVHLVEIGEYDETQVIAAFANAGDAERFVDSYNEWRPKNQKARRGDSVPYFGPTPLT
ncbi:hypothetical protein [Nocardia acidivorans]|uniref:hypothetical protein n=1 Tax=Nocardia acidivorans TaxID=404580 RepID=UPI00082F1449|nr:hypothetical protein [Nocardia acidivorans]